MLEPIRKW